MKRPFLLVEVLIAIALVALCAYPLVTPHYKLIEQKLEAVRDLQLEHAANEAFCEAQTALYEGHFFWKDLIKVDKGKPRATKSLAPVTIYVQKTKEVYEAQAVYTVEKKCKRDTRKYFRLFDIEITLSSDKKAKTYHYFLYGERLGKNK